VLKRLLQFEQTRSMWHGLLNIVVRHVGELSLIEGLERLGEVVPGVLVVLTWQER